MLNEKEMVRSSEELIQKVEATKRKALEVLESLTPNFKPQDTVEETLKSYPWGNLISMHFSQEELAQINIELDPKSCLGRAALSFAIIEKFFKGESEKYKYGEVLDDWFWNVLMNQWKNYYDPSGQPLPDGWVSELLVYEEPHAVVFGGENYQFV